MGEARWAERALDPACVRAMDEVYAKAAAEIAARGPACWASGRCCNFQKTGHRLYVTGIEAALTVSRAAELGESGVRLTLPQIEAAEQAGTCPFQEGHLCGVHAARPLGCRVYFCDRSAQEWQHELSERLLAEVRKIHDELGIEYVYGEWRGLLREVVTGGPNGPAAAPPSPSS